jgi:hypothetical protein
MQRSGMRAGRVSAQLRASDLPRVAAAALLSDGGQLHPLPPPGPSQCVALLSISIKICLLFSSLSLLWLWGVWQTCVSDASCAALHIIVYHSIEWPPECLVYMTHLCSLQHLEISGCGPLQSPCSLSLSPHCLMFSLLSHPLLSNTLPIAL